MLYLDFETRSEAELGGSLSVGVYNYANHPSTEVLMLGWAIDDGPVQIWEPHINPFYPQILKEYLEHTDEDLVAFNSTFERYIFKYKLGIELPIERFQDPQPSARYLSLPGDLESVGEILGLPSELAKDKEGKRLLTMFTEPSRRRKKRGETVEYYFKDWQTDPEDWEKFKEYCRRDIVAEREVLRREKLLGIWPLPSKERKLWITDQRINDRGIFVDVDFVKKAERLAIRAKQEAIESQNKLTGLENANSNSQMLAWVKERGFEGNSLRKEAVASAIADTTNKLTDEARAVLIARKEASSTTYKKLSTILRQVCPDGRLRNLFVYLGSSRCGRWSSSGGMQFQNMARPEKQFEEESVLEDVRRLIYEENYEEIKKKYNSVLLAIKSCIRTVFTAPTGKKMVVSDLSAIETRVAAWICGCESLLDVFRKGHDPYLDFAVKLSQIPYDTLARDIKSKNDVIKNKAKRHRQIAKPGVLACVYQLGGGSWGKTKDGDPIKTGLWGYSSNMQIDISQEQSVEIVRVFRNSYVEIPQFWYAAEKAVAEVLAEGTVRVKRELGPNGCIKISKFVFTCNGELRTILRVQLPSGRFLHYFNAGLEDVKMPWKDDEGNDVYRKTLVYDGQDQTTKQWVQLTSRGGKLLENWTQAISRDILAEDIVDSENMGLPVVAHAHDEILSEREDDMFSPDINDLVYTMSKSIDWAPNLMLGADGFESQFYKKG